MSSRRATQLAMIALERGKPEAEVARRREGGII